MLTSLVTAFKLSTRNVAKSIRSYAVYFMTLVFGVSLFYAFNAIGLLRDSYSANAMQSTVLKYMTTMLGILSVVVAMILGFLILYANRFILRRRKKEFGTYLLLGMTSSRVSLILLIESFILGLFALIFGLIIGIGISQVLYYATVSMFDMEVSGFSFQFSSKALAVTIACFMVMFGVALVFNVLTVRKSALIDLLHDRKQAPLLRLPLPVAVVLFLLSLGLFGWAYSDLLHQGLAILDRHFLFEFAAVTAGTFLFFYSVSGFFLKISQLNRRFYQSNLNTFVLRQLSNRVTSTFLSMSLVSLVLFLGAASTCSGFAIGSAMSSAVQQTTRYDVSIITPAHFEENIRQHARSGDIVGAPVPVVNDNGAAKSPEDIHAIIGKFAPDANKLIGKYAQIDVFDLGLHTAPLLASTNYPTPKQLSLTHFSESPLPVIPLSQYNATAELLGEPTVSLGSGEMLLWWDFDGMSDFWNAWKAQHPEGLTLGDGSSLRVAATSNLLMRTSSSNQNWGSIVVPDDVIIRNHGVVSTSILNAFFVGNRKQDANAFTEAIRPVYDLDKEVDAESMSAIDVATYNHAQDQMVGLQALLLYMAVYTGLIFLVACAAILGLQQLSDATDNQRRYDTLKKLGASSSMISKSLFAQIGAYFLIPVIPALAHTTVAFIATVRTVSAFSQVHILSSLAWSAGLIAVIYGCYFAATFISARLIVVRDS